MAATGASPPTKDERTTTYTPHAGRWERERTKKEEAGGDSRERLSHCDTTCTVLGGTTPAAGGGPVATPGSHFGTARVARVASGSHLRGARVAREGARVACGVHPLAAGFLPNNVERTHENEAGMQLTQSPPQLPAWQHSLPCLQHAAAASERAGRRSLKSAASTSAP